MEELKDNSPSLAEEVQAAIRAEELDESDAQLEESDAEEEDDAKENSCHVIKLKGILNLCLTDLLEVIQLNKKNT